jgi:hypothetical protein
VIRIAFARRPLKISASLALASLAVVLGSPSLAAAAAPGPPAGSPGGFSLVQKDCPDLDEHALLDLVELEMRTLSVADSRVHVEIACRNEVAAVTLTDADGRLYPIASRVDYSKAEAGARERLVALAATELVAQAEHAGRPTAAVPQKAESRPVAPASSHAESVAAEAAPARGRDEETRIEIALVGVGTVLGTPTTFLGGGALAARVGLSGSLAAVFDVRVDGGATETTPAKVTWTMLGGSAALLFEWRAGVARLGAGAGVRAASLTLEANAHTPDSGRTVSGPWLAPILPARASFTLAAPVALVATLEAGYTTLPVRGIVDGQAVVEADGPFASLGLGIAAVF